MRCWGSREDEGTSDMNQKAVGWNRVRGTPSECVMCASAHMGPGLLDMDRNESSSGGSSRGNQGEDCENRCT